MIALQSQVNLLALAGVFRIENEPVYYKLTNSIISYCITHDLKTVRKRASVRTEREKALSRLRSRPQPGARTLRILQENSIDFIMGAGEEASLYLPWS